LERGDYRVFVGDWRERDPFEDLDVEESIIIKYIFKQWGGETRTGLTCLMMGTCGVRL
jgi:hypothetical protein